MNEKQERSKKTPAHKFKAEFTLGAAPGAVKKCHAIIQICVSIICIYTTPKSWLIDSSSYKTTDSNLRIICFDTLQFERVFSIPTRVKKVFWKSSGIWCEEVILMNVRILRILR